MKGLYINGFKDISFSNDAPMPELKDGEALIRIKYAGVCGSDLHHYINPNSPFGGKPHVLGHELCGTVVESRDAGDVRYKVGDFVTAIPYTSCGKCEWCLKGRRSICKHLSVLGVGNNGSYSEYVKVPCENIYPFKKNVDKKIAALAEPLTVAVFEIHRSGLQIGQSVLITGAGPIGILMALVARRAGAIKVVLTEVNQNRINYARNFGFTVVNPLESDAYNELLKQNAGEKYDIAFEGAGPQVSFDLSASLVKPGGHYVPVALTSEPTSIDMFNLTHNQIDWIGVNLYEFDAMNTAVRIINDGFMDDELSKCVTNIFPLDQAAEAYLYAMDPQGKSIKVLIDAEA